MKKIIVLLSIFSVLFFSCDFNKIFGEEEGKPKLTKIKFDISDNSFLSTDMASLNVEGVFTFDIDGSLIENSFIPTFEGSYDDIYINGEKWEKGEGFTLDSTLTLRVKNGDKNKYYTLKCNITPVDERKPELTKIKFDIADNPFLSADLASLNKEGVFSFSIDIEQKDNYFIPCFEGVYDEIYVDGVIWEVGSAIEMSSSFSIRASIADDVAYYTLKINAIGNPEVIRATFRSADNENLLGDINSKLEGSVFSFFVGADYIDSNKSFLPSFEGNYDELFVGGTLFDGSQKFSFEYPLSVRASTPFGDSHYTLQFISTDSICVTSFSFLKSDNPLLAEDYPGVINESNGTITINMPHDDYVENINSLVAAYTGVYAAITPDLSTASDYSKGVTLYLQSGDSTVSKFYSVVINDVLNSSADIKAFTFEKSVNTSLPENIYGNVGENKISVYLPESYFNNPYTLLPTIETSSGAVVTPESGSIFTTSIVYNVTSEDGLKTKQYTVVPSIDKDSLTGLDLSGAFYMAGATKVPLSATVTTSGNNYYVSIPSSTYNSMYTYPIGFNNVDYSYNAQITNNHIQDLVYGENVPYSVNVKSANGLFSKNYNIYLKSIASSNNTLSSITATCRYVYPWSTYSANNYATQYQTFVDTLLAGFTEKIYNIGFFEKDYYDGKLAFMTDGYTHFVHFNDSTAQAASAVAVRSSAAAYAYGTEYGTTVSDQFSVGVGETWTNSYSYTAPANAYTGESSSYTFTFPARLQTQKRYTTSKIEIDITGSMIVTAYKYKTYSTEDYLRVDMYTIVKPNYSSFSGLVVDTGIIDSYTISGNNLYLYFKASNDKVTGIIATFSVIAENGASRAYTISIV